MNSIYEWPEHLDQEDFKRMIQDRLPSKHNIEIVAIDEYRDFYLNVAFHFGVMPDKFAPDVFYTHFYISDLNAYLDDLRG